MLSYQEVLKNFPKRRSELPEEYLKIYDEHYKNNRNGTTPASFISMQMEKWLHKKVASTAVNIDEHCILEVGEGTLNQFNFEPYDSGFYDVVEPYHDLYKNSENITKVRNFYDDISEIQGCEIYDRIISVACFEHILNLPEVVEKCAYLMKPDGVLSVSIPNEGRFLWRLAYKISTGREFRKKYGLDYEVLMRHEHVNTADEIEVILRHFFKSVKHAYLGIGKTFSFYRYYECRKPIIY